MVAWRVGGLYMAMRAQFMLRDDEEFFVKG